MISGVTCPICKRPTTWEQNPWRPFCSKRCQVIDLGAWAGEEYRYPDATSSAEPSEIDSESE